MDKFRAEEMVVLSEDSEVDKFMSGEEVLQSEQKGKVMTDQMSNREKRVEWVVHQVEGRGRRVQSWKGEGEE
jgi:hypothetical protein